MLGLILCFLTSTTVFATTPAQYKDEIKSLPGLQFEPNFKQYAGQLQVGQYYNIFYWFVEAQNLPAGAKPKLVLWLNGGPGCSSLLGLFTENGPFRLDYDGDRVWENVYSWNKVSFCITKVEANKLHSFRGSWIV